MRKVIFRSIVLVFTGLAMTSGAFSEDADATSEELSTSAELDHADASAADAEEDGSDDSQTNQAQGEGHTAETGGASDLPDGQELFLSAGCSGCHGENGQGTSEGAKLAGSAAVDNVEGMLTQIFYGSNLMPGFDYLSDAEIAALVNYVRTGINEKSDMVTEEEVAEFRP